MQLTRDAWNEAGREGDPDFTVFGVGPDPSAVESCLELGFNRVIFALPPADADTVLPLIKRYADLKAQYQ